MKYLEPGQAGGRGEYDEPKRELEGELLPHCGKNPEVESSRNIGRPKAKWTQKQTADDLGISQQAVSKAIKIAKAIEKYPDLAKEKSGQAILREFKRRESPAAITPLPAITSDTIKTHTLIEILHNFGMSVLEMGESFNESQVAIILSRQEGIHTWVDFQKTINEYERILRALGIKGDPGAT